MRLRTAQTSVSLQIFKTANPLVGSRQRHGMMAKNLLGFNKKTGNKTESFLLFILHVIKNLSKMPSKETLFLENFEIRAQIRLNITSLMALFFDLVFSCFLQQGQRNSSTFINISQFEQYFCHSVFRNMYKIQGKKTCSKRCVKI